MRIPGKKIAEEIKKNLKKEIKSLRKKHDLKLVVFLVGNLGNQLSFVKIKGKTAHNLGIKYKLIHFKKTPPFEEFARLIKETAGDPKTTGIIIQQPLPSHLLTDTIYNFISKEKDIEGNHPKSPYLPPIGLSILTLLKYIYYLKVDKNLIIDLKKDTAFFKKTFKNKKIVVAGRGITGGKPIGKTLSAAKINYINVNSQTPNVENYYKEADIIITAVGKKIISPSLLKQGVILINVGLRKEKNHLKGDYDEKEIEDIASFYTPTPGGAGPIDVAYLYKNLIEASKVQR